MTLAQAYRLANGAIWNLPTRRRARAEKDSEARMRAALSPEKLAFVDALAALGTEQGDIAYRSNLRAEALKIILAEHETLEGAT